MIFVFKTSVKNKTQLKRLRPSIDVLLSGAKWNFDLQDCDKILRIDSVHDIVLPITHLLAKHNFHCEELE